MGNNGEGPWITYEFFTASLFNASCLVEQPPDWDQCGKLALLQAGIPAGFAAVRTVNAAKDACAVAFEGRTGFFGIGPTGTGFAIGFFGTGFFTVTGFFFFTVFGLVTYYFKCQSREF